MLITFHDKFHNNPLQANLRIVCSNEVCSNAPDHAPRKGTIHWYQLNSCWLVLIYITGTYCTTVRNHLISTKNTSYTAILIVLPYGTLSIFWYRHFYFTS